MSNSPMLPLATAVSWLRRLSAHRAAVWLTLTGVGGLLGCLALLPASSPRAASVDPAAAENPAAESSEAPSFGTATPSDKFVQSFQQQVSQQLQSSLAQSNEAQETRLRSFEQQQRDMDNHIQALEQSLAQAQAGHAAQAAGGFAAGDSPSADFDPPRVNVRRALSAEYAGSGSGGGPGLLPAMLPVLAGEGPVAGARGLSTTLGQPPAIPDGGAYANADISPARSRANDPNIAPHGFVDGRLLNGVVTQQGGPERESIVALSGDYQSANGFTADLNGCFALVQGRPEIATGRIDFKLSRLTCNFQDGASRTWDASGWLVDADGIRGVRAVIVDNTGRKAAVAAGGGAIGGIGQRLSQQQYDITGGAVGFGSSTSFVGSAGRDALGGAASAGANALGQSINDYYNLYGPSLQVGGGTRVTVVLANDLRLPLSGRHISQTHVANP